MAKEIKSALANYGKQRIEIGDFVRDNRVDGWKNGVWEVIGLRRCGRHGIFADLKQKITGKHWSVSVKAIRLWVSE